jgi:hypothetical protein
VEDEEVLSRDIQLFQASKFHAFIAQIFLYQDSHYFPHIIFAHLAHSLFLSTYHQSKQLRNGEVKAIPNLNPASKEKANLRIDFQTFEDRKSDHT